MSITFRTHMYINYSLCLMSEDVIPEPSIHATSPPHEELSTTPTSTNSSSPSPSPAATHNHSKVGTDRTALLAMHNLSRCVPVCALIIFRP